MKKEMDFILLSLIAIGAFAVGFPGIGLAEVNAAGGQCHKDNTKQNIKKVTKDVAGEDALAIFVLKANGDIEVMEGPDPKINFRKPREMQDGQPGAVLDKQPNPSKPGEVPNDIKHEMSGSPKVSIIKTYVGDTCANINGTWYCW
jgi:hypothetical protein